MNKNISLKKVLKNGGLFVALILITFIVIFHNNNVEDILNAMSSLNIKYIIIGMICSCAFVVCEGINISRSLKLMEYKVSIFTCIKYAIVGLFFSSVTPSASGGQPMQIYFMHKDDIQISHSSLALLIDLASFQFVTAGLAIVGYITQHELLVNTLGNIKYFVALGVIINTLVLIFILTAIFSKRFITKLINFVYFILEKLKYKKLDKFKEISTAQLNEYKESAVYFKENKFTILKIVLTTIVQIVALHSVTFWIYKSFGLSEYSFITVVMLQSILYISVSALPLPGAVGVSESVFMIIYKTLFSVKILSSAMIVSRGISFYLLVFLSGIILAVNYLLNIRGKNYIKVTRKRRGENFDL